MEACADCKSCALEAASINEGKRLCEASSSWSGLLVARRAQIVRRLWRNCYIKNVALFEENSILPLPERLESSGWQFLRAEVSQGSREKSEKSGEIGLSIGP